MFVCWGVFFNTALSLFFFLNTGELEYEASVITTNVKAWIVRRNYIRVREAARTLETRWIQRRSRASSHTAPATIAPPLATVPEQHALAVQDDFVKLQAAKLQAASRGMLARRQLRGLKEQMLALLVISRNFRDRLGHWRP